ncbi:MAG TPA: PAS domain-containing protein, partial [Gemmatimonadaceae bacterium]|nr:PAS domain-containing protein [Gemmatimonadaceae bacterium]
MTAHQSAASGALDALTPHATGGGPTAHVLPMLRLVSDAALLLDRDGQILFANDRAGALLGREARTLVGCVAWDDMVAEAAEPLRRAFGESITSSAPAVALLRLGSRRPLEARFLPVEGAVILVIVDVGLRDQALAFDSIHEAVLIMDADSRIVDWNAAAEEVFGYTRAEAVGRTPEFFHHPELGGRLEREIQETLKMHGRWAGE